MPTPITTGSIPRLLQDGLRNIFGMAYDKHPRQFDKIFDVLTSTKDFEVDAQLGALGIAPPKAEGKEIDFDGFRQGFTPKYPAITYGKGFIVSKEALQDERYDQLDNKTERLAFSMSQTEEIVCANVLNRGFNSAFTMVDGDGVELLSTTHNNGPEGGTYSNKLAIDANMSESSIEDLLKLIGNFQDDRGNQIAIQAIRLICTVEDQFEAQRILGSVLQNETGNNATNAIRDMNKIQQGFTVNNYLTDPNAFFIKTNAPFGLKYYSRQAVEFGQDNAFTSGNARMKADMRMSCGWTEPRGIVGTQGG